MTHGPCDARPKVTFPVAGHRCPATGTKLCYLVTEAHVCEQLAQGRYLIAKRPGVELATSRVASQRPNHYTTRPHNIDLEEDWEVSLSEISVPVEFHNVSERPKINVNSRCPRREISSTRMLAINVSIPNLTVACLEQFPSPQMSDNKPSFTRKPLVVVLTVTVHLQLMQSQNWLPWQRPLDPRSRLCLHWIA